MVEIKEKGLVGMNRQVNLSKKVQLCIDDKINYIWSEY